MAPHEPAPPGSRQRQRGDGSWVLVVPDEHWTSEDEARRLVGSRLRLVSAVSHDRLVKAENAAHESGYLRSTVDEEARWWAVSPRWRRLLRLITDNGP